MPDDPQARATTRVANVQALLTAVIAVFTGFWAFFTYTVDQRSAAARHQEQQLRIDEQRSLERRQEQSDAISEMSRQLGLMEAQCDDEKLRTLLDQESPTRRQELCYTAYIGARSLWFLSKRRISHDQRLSQDQWDTLWKDLQDALVDAGVSEYNSKVVSDRWSSIVQSAE